MRKPILLLLGLCLAAATATADSSGFHAERLERVGEAIEAEIAAGKIAGGVALVARHGEIAYHESFGYADLASRKPMTNDAIFRIASMTKAVTSVGVMMLYERGHFALNDPVSDHLPAFAEPVVAVAIDDNGRVTETRPASREIRIVDLLAHASGIGYTFIPHKLQASYQEAGVPDGLMAADMALAEGMTRLATQPLLFDPGSGYEYGLNTDVLGYLIEVVSGMPLDRFFAEEIFEPLGMEDTFFYLPDDRADRLVTLYADVDGLRVSDGTEADIKLDNPRYPVEGARRYFSGGAGLSSTAYDYFRFIQMLLNDGELDGQRVLGRKSVELMRSPRVDWDGDGAADFGLGFQVTSDLGKSGELGSAGLYAWGGAYNTTYWIDPAEGVVAVFMSQVRPYTGNIRSRFRTAVYQALE